MVGPDAGAADRDAETTLHQWIRRMWVRAHQQAQPPRRWIVWADGAEVERLSALHQRPAGYATRRLWVRDVDLPPNGASVTSRDTADY